MRRVCAIGLGLVAVVALGAGCSANSPAGPESAPSSRPPASNGAVESKQFVKVPHIPAYVSVEVAKRRLERVGLVGVEPDVDWPHYFVNTRPKAGTRVEVGSEVRLLIGDG